MTRVYMTFIELILSNEWVEYYPANNVVGQLLIGSKKWQASGQAFIELVEPEIVIRRFAMKDACKIEVGNGIVAFYKEDINDEFTLEKEHKTIDGKRLKMT